MTPRFNYGKVAPHIYQAMDALDRYLHQCDVENPGTYQPVQLTT